MARRPARAIFKCKPCGTIGRVRNGEPSVQNPSTIGPVAAPMSGLREECWAITDTAAGNQRQALALAERLGLPVRPLVLEPRGPWAWLAPRLTLGAAVALPPDERARFGPPWPRVAVGCGRAAALFTRLLRPWSGGRCQAVQILDPRVAATHWDIVADSGQVKTRAFCPTCGSPVYVAFKANPGFMAVHAASLDDPARFKPHAITFTSGGLGWDQLDPSLQGYAKMPG